MSYFKLDDAVELYYEEKGSGQPVLFIHGVWMSSRFFQKQMSFFGERYRAISVDLRGHGRSSHVHSGHTVANYARDIRAFINGLGLKDVVLVGWSMGSFVIWDYFKQFGDENIKATVVLSQSPSDFIWPDWPHGFTDFQGLAGMMTAVQTDRAEFVKGFIPQMLKKAPSEEDFKWMFEEITMLPETIAGSILFDQTCQDYRPVIPDVNVKTLLCFGREGKLIPLAGGEYLEKHLPDSQLKIFENSDHCPFLEETDLLNKELDEFIASLG